MSDLLRSATMRTPKNNDIRLPAPNRKSFTPKEAAYYADIFGRSKFASKHDDSNKSKELKTPTSLSRGKRGARHESPLFADLDDSVFGAPYPEWTPIDRRRAVLDDALIGVSPAKSPRMDEMEVNARNTRKFGNKHQLKIPRRSTESRRKSTAHSPLVVPTPTRQARSTRKTKSAVKDDDDDEKEEASIVVEKKTNDEADKNELLVVYENVNEKSAKKKEARKSKAVAAKVDEVISSPTESPVRKSEQSDKSMENGTPRSESAKKTPTEKRGLTRSEKEREHDALVEEIHEAEQEIAELQDVIKKLSITDPEKAKKKEEALERLEEKHDSLEEQKHKIELELNDEILKKGAGSAARPKPGTKKALRTLKATSPKKMISSPLAIVESMGLTREEEKAAARRSFCYGVRQITEVMDNYVPRDISKYYHGKATSELRDRAMIFLLRNKECLLDGTWKTTLEWESETLRDEDETQFENVEQQCSGYYQREIHRLLNGLPSQREYSEDEGNYFYLKWDDMDEDLQEIYKPFYLQGREDMKAFSKKWIAMEDREEAKKKKEEAKLDDAIRMKAEVDKMVEAKRGEREALVKEASAMWTKAHKSMGVTFKHDYPTTPGALRNVRRSIAQKDDDYTPSVKTPITKLARRKATPRRSTVRDAIKYEASSSSEDSDAEEKEIISP